MLYHGNCLDILPTLDRKVDMVLCDLPYGTTQCSWDSVIPLSVMWAALKPSLRESTPVCLFGTEPFSSSLRMSNLKNYKYDWIWYKPKGLGFLNAKKQPMRNHEVVSVFYEKQPLYVPQMTEGHPRKISLRRVHLQAGEIYGQTKQDNLYDSTKRYPQSVIEFSSDTQNSSFHPTQKPVALCEYLIKTYTNPGDTVLDFTMGSGTTGVACRNTGRQFIGIELEEKYFLTAKTRIEAANDNHQQEKEAARPTDGGK